MNEAQRHHRRAEILSDLGRSERALEEAFAAIASDPEDAAGYFSAARALLGAERDEEALEFANKGLGRRTTSWGLRLRSIALSALGREVEALEAAEEAVALSPDEWRCHTRIARCYTRLYRLADADAALAKAAELNPDGHQVHAQWARVACALAEWDRAEALARRAVALAPTEGVALSALGHVLFHKRPPDDLGAFAAYVTAFRGEPGRADLRERVVESGRRAVWVSVDVFAGVWAVGMAALVGLSFVFPWAWCLVTVALFVGVWLYRAGVARARRKLDEAVEGGAALFEQLWRGSASE